jgi:hypothetical protein
MDPNYEGNSHAGLSCLGQDHSTISSAGQQTMAIESNPLACIFCAVLRQKLLFPAALRIQCNSIDIDPDYIGSV